MWKKLKNVYNGKTKEKRKNYNWKKYLAAKEYLQKKICLESLFFNYEPVGLFSGGTTLMINFLYFGNGEFSSSSLYICTHWSSFES